MKPSEIGSGVLQLAPNAPDAVFVAGVVAVCFARLVLALIGHGASVAVLAGMGAGDPHEEAAHGMIDAVTGALTLAPPPG